MDKRTTEDIYEDIQNMVNKLDIQHNQLRISNNVIDELKKEIKEKDAKNMELLKQIDIFKKEKEEWLKNDEFMTTFLIENNMETPNDLYNFITKYNNHECKCDCIPINNLRYEDLKDNIEYKSLLIVNSGLVNTCKDNKTKIQELEIQLNDLKKQNIIYNCKTIDCINKVEIDNKYCKLCTDYLNNLDNEDDYEGYISEDNDDKNNIPKNIPVFKLFEEKLHEKNNANESEKEDITSKDKSSNIVNHKKEPDENILNNEKYIDDQSSRKINKESNNLLNRIKNNYINFSNSFLPDTTNMNIYENYKTINNNIITKKRINIENIIQYYNIYEKFIKLNNNVNSNSFYKFIEYNEDKYNKDNYYKINKIYEKIKKCYNFISFFKNKEINEDIIIDIIYKSNLSYTKLYKIKKKDYEDLNHFFLDIFNINKKRCLI